MTAVGRSPAVARGLLAATAVLVGCAAVLAASTAAGPGLWVSVVAAAAYLSLGLLGLLLAERTPCNPAAWVLLATAFGAALLPVVDLIAPQFAGGGIPVAGVVRALAAAALLSTFTVGVLVFPDGRGHGRLGRTLVPIAWAAIGLLAAGAVLSGGAGGGPVAAVGDGLILAGFALTVPLTVLAAVTATARRRSTTGDHRRGLRLVEVTAWANAAAFVGCAAISMLGELPAWFGVLADQTGVIFAIAAWIGIVRFRLVDLRGTIAHTVAYLLASVLIGGVAIAVAALLGSAVAGWLGAGIGAVVAALAALLLRDRLQTAANLLVYGRRVDPVTEHARRLEQALRDSHRLLVTARDDERQRIRRDLHDGLGPTLAGIVLGVDGVERHLDDPVQARAELARLREAGQQAVSDVRRIVYDLRPPILDSLGLDGAIREQADRLGASSVEISALPDLPDSLEIGVYLIALEAMKNAATHARPGAFWVRLDAADQLALEVLDDGPGLAAGYRPGAGIRSMRDRAAELGGTLDLLPRQPHGTWLRAEWGLPT